MPTWVEYDELDITSYLMENSQPIALVNSSWHTKLVWQYQYASYSNGCALFAVADIIENVGCGDAQNFSEPNILLSLLNKDAHLNLSSF